MLSVDIFIPLPPSQYCTPNSKSLSQTPFRTANVRKLSAKLLPSLYSLSFATHLLFYYGRTLTVKNDD